MWFKNLQIYGLAGDLEIKPAELAVALAAKPMPEMLGLSMSVWGWLPVFEQDSKLVVEVDGHILMRWGQNVRVLPGAVIKKVVQERAKELEAAQGFKPGTKQLRDLKDRVTMELLPQAFVKPRSVMVWVDLANQRVIVNSSSISTAESVLESLRDTLGSLPVVRLPLKTSAQAKMTAWLSSEVPAPLSAEDEGQLERRLGDRTESISYSGHDLSGGDVKRYIEEGRVVTRMGACYAERLNFVLMEPFQIRRLKSLVMAEAGQVGDEPVAGGGESRQASVAEVLATDFQLMAAEVSAMLSSLIELMGGLEELSSHEERVEKYATFGKDDDLDPDMRRFKSHIGRLLSDTGFEMVEGTWVKRAVGGSADDSAAVETEDGPTGEVDEEVACVAEAE